MNPDSGASISDHFTSLAGQAKTSGELFDALASILQQSSTGALVLAAVENGRLLVTHGQRQTEERTPASSIPLPANIRKLRPASPVRFERSKLPAQADGFYGLLRGLNCPTGAIVPIGAGGSLAGIIILGGSEKDDFTTAGLEIYRSLAALAGSALEKIRSGERLKKCMDAFEVRRAFLSAMTPRKIDREQVIADFSDRLWAAPDIEAVLRTALEQLGRAFGAAEGLIELQIEDCEGDPAL